MVHAADPADALDEFTRVLRPGGYVVGYQTVATDRLAADEADWLFDVMGVVPDSADPDVLDEAIAGSGLDVVDTIDLRVVSNLLMQKRSFDTQTITRTLWIMTSC